MVKSITITNNRGESVMIPLANPYDSGFAISSIDGITPENASINMTDLSVSDGSVYFSSRLPNREITFKIILLPADTIEETRHRIYKYFPIKQKIRITFETDIRTVYIDGYVQNNSINIFSKNETANITVNCPDPYFKDVNSAEINIEDSSSLFEFPFCIELSDPIPISEASDGNYIKTVENNGYIDTGFVCDFTFKQNMTTGNTIYIFHDELNKMMTIDVAKIASIVGEGLVTGDVIRLDTRRGSRSLLVTHNVTGYNCLSALGYSINWLYLVGGTNTFTFYNRFSVDDMNIRLYANLNYQGV